MTSSQNRPHYNGGQGKHHQFTGEEQSSGSRGQGRLLHLNAKSADMLGKLKHKRHTHKDKSKFKDVANQWGTDAGLSSVQVDPEFGNVERDYWSMSNEHFMEWGYRTAREMGATFKIYGDQAVFAKREGGSSVSGQDLTPIYVTWGDNLISWQASPTIGRPGYKDFSTKWYDPSEAKWNTENESADSAGLQQSTLHHSYKHADKDKAKSQSKSNKSDSNRDKGNADTVTIDGNPDATPEAPCILSGIREGIDGLWLIAEVNHKLSRGSGFTTELKLKQPSGDAGTDSRGGSG